MFSFICVCNCKCCMRFIQTVPKHHIFMLYQGKNPFWVDITYVISDMFFVAQLI